jgi:hypothetical protein
VLLELQNISPQRREGRQEEILRESLLGGLRVFAVKIVP